MSDLVRTAVRKAAVDLMWANPKEDKQAMFKLTRISPVRGTRDALQLPFIFIPKPEERKRFIYYSLGTSWPRRLGLEKKNLSNWRRMSDLSVDEDIIIMPFIKQMVIPNTKLWMMRTEDGNSFFALEIEKLKDIFDLNEDLNIRFYSNAWLSTTKEGQSREGIRHLSGVIGDDLTVAEVISKINEWEAKPDGGVLIYKNGYYVTNPNIPNITNGDTFNIHYDSSIRVIFDYPLRGAHYFFSERDEGKRKMLIPLPADLRYGQQWNDDIEFIISETQDTTIPFEKGVYLPKKDVYNIRNITTNDYSVDEEYLQSITRDHRFIDSMANTKIRLILREADRPEFLFKDGLNLHDFFIIPHDMRVRILKGLEPEFEKWTAAALENSNYMHFSFTDKQWNYPLKEIFNFYGNQYYSNQPYKIYDGIFRIPPSMRAGGLLLEFDSDGVLLNIVEWVQDNFTLRYYPEVRVDKIRCVPGVKITSGIDLDLFSTYIDDEVTDWYEERYYKSPNNNNWSLGVLGQDFELVDGKVNWKSAYLDFERRKRIADHYVRKELTVDSGELGLPIDLFDDYSTTYTGLGFGHYYVFLNNRLLVYGVDYEVIFPKFYILNEEYAALGEDNHIVIIGHGCPHFNADPETGFIEEGRLTTKKGFRPLLHRNRDFFVDGRLLNEDTIVFDSGYKLAHNQNDRLDPSIREGALFGVDDHTNHLGLEDIEAITETQQEALQTDEFARLALDEYYPSPDRTGKPPIVISTKHTVISIVLRKLLEEIKTGRLVIPKANLSDLAVSVMFNPYRYLLDYDISLKDLEHTYLEVAAHGYKERIDLSIPEHQFLHKVNEMFLKGRCVLPQYFDI